MNKDAIKELVAASQAGDQEAFCQLLDIYNPLINSTVSKFRVEGMPEADMDDLRQEAVIAFYSALMAYDPAISEVEFGLYAKVCLCNRLVSQTRVIKRRLINSAMSYNAEDLMRYVASDGDPVKSVVESEEEELLLKLIRDNLSDRENLVFRMYTGGMSGAEMAKKLGVNEKSVNNAIYRIRKKLKKLLKE